MSILNFLTQDQLDDLDEDPRIAFMELVNHAQRRLDEQVRKLDGDQEHEWREIEELRYSFINVVVAAAKRLEVEPFVSMDVPQYGNFQQSDYRQFKSDVDHYVTQIMLDNSIRSKKNSVDILPASKDKIRSYVHGLRDCIEKSNMTKAKRQTLLNKLDAFERELERRRLSLLAVTLLTFDILAIPGATWASVEITQKLVTNVMQVVAEAKAKEDETRQIPSKEAPKVLSAPRPPPPAARPARTGPSWDAPAAKGGDLDDEIPF